MFKGIPQKRLILYTLILGLIPIFAVCMHLGSGLSSVNQLKQRLPELQEFALIKEGKLSQNRVVKAHYADADHFYIDKQLESLTFLGDEIDGLNELSSISNYGNHPAMKRRLDFLTGEENRLVFTEGVVQGYPDFQETQETLLHPIEINGEDLKKLLAKIEGKGIGPYAAGPGRPQLLITEFKLDKKNTFGSNEVFILNLRLLKREFL